MLKSKFPPNTLNISPDSGLGGHKLLSSKPQTACKHLTCRTAVGVTAQPLLSFFPNSTGDGGGTTKDHVTGEGAAEVDYARNSCLLTKLL